MIIKNLQFKYFLGFIGLFIACTLQATNISWTGASSNDWNDPANWSTNTVPTATDDVTISAGPVELNTAATVQDLIFEGGHLSGTGTLTINRTFDWVDEMAILDQGLTVIIATGANFSLVTPPNYQFGRISGAKLIVNGTMTLKAGYFGANPFMVNGTLNWVYGNIDDNVTIGSNGTLNLNGDLEGYQRLVDDTLFNNGTVIWDQAELRTAGGAFVNNGTFNINATDNIVTGGFPPLGNEIFINNGVVNVASGVSVITMDVRFENNGTINLGGSSDWRNFNSFTQNGIFEGGEIGQLSFLGNGPNTFTASSVTRNLATLLHDSPYMGTTVEANASFEDIDLFNLRQGAFISNTALPELSDYKIGSMPIDFGVYGGWTQNVDMTIRGTLEMGYGFLKGSAKLTIFANDAVWNGCLVSADLVNWEGSTLTIGQAGQAFSPYVGYLGNIDNPNEPVIVENFGTINIVGDGILGSNDKAIWRNFTVMNVTADSFYLGNNYLFEGFAVSNLTNEGSINISAGVSSLTIGLPLVNENNINLAGNTNLYLASLQQNDDITGNGGKITAYGYEVFFNNGSNTTGFTEFTTTCIDTGAYMPNCNIGSPSVIRVVTSLGFSILKNMPANASYVFDNSIVYLETPLNPTGSVTSNISSIYGNGSLSINNSFNWTNGYLDIPVTINAGATAQVSTDSVAIFYSPSPTAGAALVNNGTLTWLNGAILADQQTITNGGTWEIESPTDVLMGGSNSFVNNGTFSNCSSSPVAVIFDLPVTNNGILKGSGSFTFNGSFTNNGTVNPGCSPGQMVINGNFTAGSAINIEIEGPGVGEHDHLQVNGNMTAAGILNLIIPPGTNIGNGLYIIESTGNMSGNFSQINVPQGYQVNIVGNQVELLAAPPLPIELSFFTASLQGKQVSLRWETANERNSASFEVEHSRDGRLFTPIGSILAAGNSTVAKQYSFLHPNPIAGLNYYRLRQIDRDGTQDYSPVQSVRLISGSWDISPNLVRDFIRVQREEATEKEVLMQVFNQQGQLVATAFMPENTLTFDWDISMLPVGKYILTWLDATENQSVKFVKY